MQPASLPSGSGFPPREGGFYGNGPKEAILMNFSSQLDQALSDYLPHNMFHYESVCKKMFMQNVMRNNQHSLGLTFNEQMEIRSGLQRIMNNKFLKFQIKEKEYKQSFQRQAEERDRQASIGPASGNLNAQFGPSEDENSRFITKSRRKRINPRMIKEQRQNEIREMNRARQTNEGAEQLLYPSSRMHFPELARQQSNSALLPPVSGRNVLSRQHQSESSSNLMVPPRNRLAQSRRSYQLAEVQLQDLEEPMNGFLNRFTDQDKKNEKREEMKRIHKQALDRQIQEREKARQFQKQLEQQEELKLQNEVQTNYFKELNKQRFDLSEEVSQRPVTPIGQVQNADGRKQLILDNQDLTGMRRAVEPINYLSNSNNVHQILRTLPDPENPLRRNVNGMVRGPGSDQGSSRSRSRGRIGDPVMENLPFLPGLAGGAPLSATSRTNQQPGGLPQQQLMQNQALDFIGVLKDLIASTVDQQQALNQQILNSAPNMGGPAIRASFDTNYHLHQLQQSLAQQQARVDDLLNSRDAGKPQPAQLTEQNLRDAALKETNLIESYVKEIGELRSRKEELLEKELETKLANPAKSQPIPTVVKASKNQGQQRPPFSHPTEQPIQSHFTEKVATHFGKGPAEDSQNKDLQKMQETFAPHEEQRPPPSETHSFRPNPEAMAPPSLGKPPSGRVASVAESKASGRKPPLAQLGSAKGEAPNQKPPSTSSQKKDAPQPESFEEKKIESSTAEQQALQEKINQMKEKAGLPVTEEGKKNQFEDDGEDTGFRTRDQRLAELELNRLLKDRKHNQEAKMRVGAQQTEEFDHSRNVGPSGETKVKAKIKKIEEQREAMEKPEVMQQFEHVEERAPNILPDHADDPINLAQEMHFPRQQINSDLVNQVRNNFVEYDDFVIFQSGLPPSMVAPLRRDQSNYPTEPNPSKLKKLVPPPPEETNQFMTAEERAAFAKSNALQSREFRQAINEQFSILDHQISQDVEKVMKENFEYEARAVQSLFQKQSMYKPIVSGLFGQTIVKTNDHLLGSTVEEQEQHSPKTVKEMNVANLVKTIENNAKKINLVQQDHPSITDNYNRFRQKEEENKINLTMVEEEPQKAPTNDEYPLPVLTPKAPEDPKNSIHQPSDFYEQQMLELKQDTLLTDPADRINLGAPYEDLADEDMIDDLVPGEEIPKDIIDMRKNKSEAVFPVQSVKTFTNDKGTEVDSEAIKDRILTLKLMFEDAEDLRKKREFLSSNQHQPNILTSPAKEQNDLNLVRQFNLEKKVVEPPEQTGRTRMISSFIRDIREQRAKIRSTEEKKDKLLQEALAEVNEKPELADAAAQAKALFPVEEKPPVSFA